jgi:hypothetical protein
LVVHTAALCGVGLQLYSWCLVPMSEPTRYFRKVIQIRGQDSPNVRLALAQMAAGKEPTGEVIIPGVLPWQDYATRRATWDKVRQSIGLDAEFWEGAEVLLYPPDWRARAEQLWRMRLGDPYLRQHEQATAIGIDPAEGGDRTAMCAVNAKGILELVSKQTPNTAVIHDEAIAFMYKWHCPPEMVVFDRGGGGKQISDWLERDGYKVRTMGFGEGASPELRRGLMQHAVRVDEQEERYAYKNRRAEVYFTLHMMLDPSDPLQCAGFGMPGAGEGEVYQELQRQLALFPRRLDGEGRIYLPPKRKPTKDSEAECLEDILGCSPDEADALVLAIYGLRFLKRRPKAGVGI